MVLVNALRKLKKKTCWETGEKSKELAVGNKLVITPPCLWSNSGVLVLSDNASFPLLQGVPGNLRRNILTSDLSTSFSSTKTVQLGFLKKLFTGL